MKNEAPFSVQIFSKIHGGQGAVGKRKAKRPLSFRKAMAVCFVSSKAQGPWGLQLPSQQMKWQSILRKQARRHRIRLAEIKAQSNSISLVLRCQSREQFQNFLRSSSALVARAIMGAKKGQRRGKFWDFLAASLILEKRWLISRMDQVLLLAETAPRPLASLRQSSA